MNGQASRLIQLKKLTEKERSNSITKTISVCSGKGGTGKTFFAANFAFQLSKLNKKILLVDLDLNFSNLNVIMNKASENSISNFFEQRCSLKELVYNFSKNLDLIYGDSGRLDYPRISEDIIDYFFMSLEKMHDEYDYIIFDSAAGADDLVMHQLSKSQYIIIVTSPEPTAVMDAYVILKLLKENINESEKLIVVNKCNEHEEGERTIGNISTACRHFLGQEINKLGFISFDNIVHRSIVDQELLLNYNPLSMVAQEILELSTRFLKIEHLANNNHSKISI
jgi:flagellar biosynthesis protein FlhG